MDRIGLVTHAYDLELDEARLALVLRHADDASRLLPGMVAAFFDAVQHEIH